jgi:hypothetical protein
LLVIALFCQIALRSQSYMEGFESGALPSGWDTINLSGPTPGTVPAWFPSSYFISPPAAQEGSLFYAANFEAVGNTGTISTWLFTPVRTLNNGDFFSFYSRTVVNTAQYPDRLEIKMTTNGSSTNVGTSPTSVGDYSVQLGVINPNLTLIGYPTTWTKYSFSLSGFPASGINGRIGFRYYVTNSGPSGTNGDGIGIDSVYYQPNLGVGITQNSIPRFRFFPNPSQGKIQLSFPVPSEDRELIIETPDGGIVYRAQVNRTVHSEDLSFLSKGIYFLTIRERNSMFIEKIILE